MTGKIHSLNNRGKRRKSDFYQTPFSMTEQLLENETFDDVFTVIEPCVGEGAISKVLKKNKLTVYEMDINKGQDYLKFKADIGYKYIITNPPFSLAKEFIQKSKEIYTEKIAMLLPLNYLHGQERYNIDIFNELKCIYVFTRYPMLTDKVRKDGKYNTGMMVYAWYIWQKDYKGKPKINWIDNNKYVLKRGEK